MTFDRQLAVVVTLLALLAPPLWAKSTTSFTSSAVALAPADAVSKARSLVQADLAERGYPGIAVAVSVGGQMVWSEGFGYADLEHRVPMWPSVKFRFGSISK